MGETAVNPSRNILFWEWRGKWGETAVLGFILENGRWAGGKCFVLGLGGGMG